MNTQSHKKRKKNYNHKQNSDLLFNTLHSSCLVIGATRQILN